MSKSTDKAIDTYVRDQMPEKVRKALSHALYELWYGPSGEGMGFVKAAKIVNDWWSTNMRSDLVVDEDSDSVSTQHYWDKWVEKTALERYKEARKELKTEGVDDEEERNTEYGYVTELEYQAMQSADFETQSLNENAIRYDSRDVKHIVLGSEWP
jgi:hypoxanthine phosphoribosyltransferase